MSEEQEAVKWTAELEVALFHSMHRHKPVGQCTQYWNSGMHSLKAPLSLHVSIACHTDSAPFSILERAGQVPLLLAIYTLSTLVLDTYRCLPVV